MNEKQKAMLRAMGMVFTMMADGKPAKEAATEVTGYPFTCSLNPNKKGQDWMITVPEILRVVDCFMDYL